LADAPNAEKKAWKPQFDKNLGVIIPRCKVMWRKHLPEYYDKDRNTLLQYLAAFNRNDISKMPILNGKYCMLSSLGEGNTSKVYLAQSC
jgi:hypothetical protein